MITELFFNMIFSVVDIVLTVIPSFNVPVLGSLAGVIELFSLSSFLVPWNAVLNCLLIAFVFYNLATVTSIVNWVIRKIPGLS